MAAVRIWRSASTMTVSSPTRHREHDLARLGLDGGGDLDLLHDIRHGHSLDRLHASVESDDAWLASPVLSWSRSATASWSKNTGRPASSSCSVGAGALLETTRDRARARISARFVSMNSWSMGILVVLLRHETVAAPSFSSMFVGRLHPQLNASPKMGGPASRALLIRWLTGSTTVR